VLKLADDSREVNPVNLDPRLTKMADGVHRLDGQLMVVLDVDRILENLAPTSWRHKARKPGNAGQILESDYDASRLRTICRRC